MRFALLLSIGALVSGCAGQVDDGSELIVGESLVPKDATGRGGGTALSLAGVANPDAIGIGYGGGPVMLGTPDVYYIWYGNWSGNSATTLLPDFMSNLGGSPYFNINTTYYDSQGRHVTGPDPLRRLDHRQLFARRRHHRRRRRSHRLAGAVVGRAADQHQRGLFRADVERRHALRLLRRLLRLAHQRQHRAATTSSTRSSATPRRNARAAARPTRRAPTATSAPTAWPRCSRTSWRSPSPIPISTRGRTRGRREWRQVRLEVRHDVQDGERRPAPT